MKLKSFGKLLLAIIISQSAGLIGTFFTFSAIPNWYNFLDKPAFAPPNWVFGPVWTILYTLIGVSLYLIWINKKKPSLKLFWFHLFLNAIWSPVFFGLKNLPLAFLIILTMVITLTLIIKNFYKTNKLAGIILVPYLLWISFASVLNYSIWRLNAPIKNTVYAQTDQFSKSRADYVFMSDNYQANLFDFNFKKGAYNQNPTLSHKEEFRQSTYKFLTTRNKLITTYLTLLRVRVDELVGLTTEQKSKIFERIDEEVLWYNAKLNFYFEEDTLEDIVNKSKDEDLRYLEKTDYTIKYTLLYIGLGNITEIEEEHRQIYNDLKTEAQNLIVLKRLDNNLFDRWFNDIEKELDQIDKNEEETIAVIELMFSNDNFRKTRIYEDAKKILISTQSNLVRLNSFIMELETVVNDKR